MTAFRKQKLSRLIFREYSSNDKINQNQFTKK